MSCAKIAGVSKPVRRLYAVIAAFAVAFGSLWPLVSAAAPRSHDIPSFICSQSGFQQPGAPAQADDKFHCALCVLGMESPPPPAMLGAVIVRMGVVALANGSVPAAQPSFLARPPPSRAPPKLA